MHQKTNATLLAALTLGAVAGVAQTQFSFSDGDLLVGFRDNSSTLLLDLGNVTSFANTYGAGASKGTYTVPTGSLVGSVFSADAGVGISWSAAATYYNSAPNGQSTTTLFVSETQSSPGYATLSASKLFSRGSQAVQGQTSTQINGLGTAAVQATMAAIGAGNLSPLSTAHAAILPAGLGGDYSTLVQGVPVPNGAAYGTFSTLTKVENTTVSPNGNNLVGQEELIYLQPGASTLKGKELGYFSLYYNGGVTTLQYTGLAPVPEPAAFAVIGAVGLVGFGVWRRSIKK